MKLKQASGLQTRMDAAAERLQQEPSVCAAYLHGSAAKQRLRPDSDVDIAVLPMPRIRISAQERAALAGELESLLGRTADIGVLSTGNLVYAKEVLEHGRPLFTKNPFLSDRFFSTCLAMYADLQQDRKEVLDAYSA